MFFINVSLRQKYFCLLNCHLSERRKFNTKKKKKKKNKNKNKIIPNHLPPTKLFFYIAVLSSLYLHLICQLFCHLTIYDKKKELASLKLNLKIDQILTEFYFLTLTAWDFLEALRKFKSRRTKYLNKEKKLVCVFIRLENLSKFFPPIIFKRFSCVPLFFVLFFPFEFKKKICLM